MAFSYPASWQALKYPNLRHELLEYLKDICAFDIETDAHEIDFIYHYFFDDTDLHDANECIGEILFNADEAKIILALTQELDLVIDELGNVGTPAFVQHPKWSKIVSVANHALRLLEENGRPSWSP